MRKTGAGLAAWAENAHKSGWVYWYGTCAYKCTQSLLNSKTKQYPTHYTDKRRSKYEKHIADGRTCADCVGLIKGYAWDSDDDIKTRDGKYGSNDMPDKSAPGMYQAAKIKGKISTLPEIPGALVWTKSQGHVGVYIGGGEVVEARDFSHGVQRNKLAARSFTHWGLCPYIEYTAEETEKAEKAAGASIPKSGDTLQKGDKGDAVREMQRFLLEAGCKLERYGADGDFGAETLEALKAYQMTHALTPDGICGPLTWESLRGGKSPSEGQETPDTGKPAQSAGQRPTIRKGSRGEAVKEMQTLLVKAGCNLPLYGIDSHCGSETVAAIKAYQTANGLTADGICGPLTWAKLAKA